MSQDWTNRMMVGRQSVAQLPNQRCACGSGRKFKKCCMSKGMTNEPPPPPTLEERLARIEGRREGRRAMAEMEAMVASIMLGPGFQRMEREREERYELERLQKMVDEIHPSGDNTIVVIGR